MKTIATVTLNPVIDKSASVPYVAPEIKMRCHTVLYDPGGGGINVSRAIHNMGGASTAIYTRGGLTGQRLEDLLKREGVVQLPIPVEASTRENFIAYDEQSTQQYRFGMPGEPLTEKEWQAALDALRQLDPKPDFVVGSGSLPPGVPDDFYAQMSAIAKELGAKMILDTSGDALSAALEKSHMYLLKPNLNELEAFADEEMQGEEDHEKVAQHLIQTGRCEVVVVSLGGAGVLFVTADHTERLRSPTVPIRSKVGAGDSMVGGITLSLARGAALREAVLYGIAAGSAAVMNAGPELCRLEDVERLYQRLTRQTAV